jgi:hypothetical protein
MSIADNAASRAAFQSRIILVIRTIEELRNLISIAQSLRPPAETITFLGECDFHMEEAQDELRRAASRIAQIEEPR